MVYIVSFIVLALWAAALLAANDVHHRVRGQWLAPLMFWEASRRRGKAAQYPVCPQPHYHETMDALGYRCEECKGETETRPAYWRLQLGPAVVVWFDAPWKPTRITSRARQGS